MKQPTNDILLGYEVGTGVAVKLPLRHMVITGQTQEAGKTTALEALIARSGVRAVCFVTKRGEGSFASAARIDPYFREQADWQFVAAILEASRGERLKYERSWIIRASKGARTLADVQRNVRESLKKAHGQNEGAYLCLDAYLEVVVPQIAEIEWATKVQLGSGVNAMDLTGLASEMQQLVIRSSLDWVLNKEANTVVVVPEAWKFCPQGRGTPVKLGAEAYIRQGAGLGNYLWLDSQDIAGVDKTILKNVPVWVLGVQRESNEIKRTLDQIPGGIKKPKPDQIATLKLGEFFACWGSTIARVYVQPAWMSEADARAIARGEVGIADMKQTTPQPTTTERPAPPTKEKPVQKSEIDQIVEGVTRGLAGISTKGRPPAGEEPAGPRAPAPTSAVMGDEEAVYQRFKARLVKEAPALVRVLAVESEIEVKVERKTVEANQDTWLGVVATLVHEGFLDEPTGANAVWKEGQRRFNIKGIQARAWEQLEKLAAMGFLTKEDGGYQAVPSAKKRVKTS